MQELLQLDCAFPPTSEGEVYTNTKLCAGAPVLLALFLGCLYAGLRAMRRLRSWRDSSGSPRAAQSSVEGFTPAMSGDLTLFVNVGICLLNLAYTPIVGSSIRLFKCTQLADGTEALFSAPSLDCSTAEYDGTVPFAIFTIVAWAIALPLVIGAGVKQMSHSKVHAKQFNLTTYGYKLQHCYWEWCECFKRFGILAFATWFPGVNGAVLVLVWLIAFSLALLTVRPFVNSLVMTAHVLADFAIVLILLSGISSASASERHASLQAVEGVGQSYSNQQHTADGFSVFALAFFVLCIFFNAMLVAIELLATSLMPSGDAQGFEDTALKSPRRAKIAAAASRLWDVGHEGTEESGSEAPSFPLQLKRKLSKSFTFIRKVTHPEQDVNLGDFGIHSTPEPVPTGSAIWQAGVPDEVHAEYMLRTAASTVRESASCDGLTSPEPGTRAHGAVRPPGPDVQLRLEPASDHVRLVLSTTKVLSPCQALPLSRSNRANPLSRPFTSDPVDDAGVAWS